MYRKKQQKSEKFSDFSSPEDKDVSNLRNLFFKVKRKYNLSTPELITKIEEKEVVVPVVIFNNNLSSLESVVKYLKENLNLATKEIAKLLNRNEKTIYQAYSSSKEKLQEEFKEEESKFYIPISILRERKLGVLESIVKFLHEVPKLKFSEISRLIQRDQRTIWTAYSRANKKL